MTAPAWLIEARKYEGLKEIKGTLHEPLILKFRKLVHSPFNDDESAWCSAFVGACFELVGIRSTRSDLARSWLKWGVSCPPILGAVAVFWRENPKSWKGHVGFVVGKDKNDNLIIFSGNTENMVKIAPFKRERLLDCRWWGALPLPEPLPILDSNGEVSTNEA